MRTAAPGTAWLPGVGDISCTLCLQIDGALDNPEDSTLQRIVPEASIRFKCFPKFAIQKHVYDFKARPHFQEIEGCPGDTPSKQASASSSTTAVIEQPRMNLRESV